MFSKNDRKNDESITQNCVVHYTGACWYGDYNLNLNWIYCFWPTDYESNDIARVRSFANGSYGMPMPSEASPLAAIGYHCYQCHANVYR